MARCGICSNLPCPGLRINGRIWKFSVFGTENRDFEEDIMIKNLALILSIIFIILTFIGAGYVLFNDGKVNAGYACVPMIFALISISFYRKYK